MINEKKSNKKLYLRRIALRMILVFYDVIAINVSFVLTLYLRFYVAEEMHAGAVHFFELFTKYTPFYTFFCILVFACFKLYSGMWKYAGFNDLNRIIVANIVCALGHILGTLLFIQRMPKSFYLLGGLIQLFLIGFIRFSFKLLEIEKNIIFGTKKSTAIRAMIVGIDGSTRNLIRRLEDENTVHPVCVIDYEILGMGTILDGIPVISGIDRLEESIDKYNVNYVIISSRSMDGYLRDNIRNVCLNRNVEIQDYYDDFGGNISMISYRELVDIISSNIEIVHDSIDMSREDISSCRNVIDNYIIVGMSAHNDTISIKVKDRKDTKLNLNEEWVKEQEKKTGEEISFF